MNTFNEIARQWHKEPSVKGRLRLIREELSYTYEQNWWKTNLSAAALVLAASLTHSHVQTAQVTEEVEKALGGNPVPSEMTVVTQGVERRGKIYQGHAQIATDEFPEANKALQAFAPAACQIADMKVTEGRLVLPLTQHFSSSNVVVTKFADKAFKRDSYVCVPDVKPG